MKSWLLLICIFCILKVNAQNYLISFAGTGASTTVNSVKVENLAAGISLTLNGSDILRLNFTTGINSIDYNQTSELRIYPNPMIDNSTLEIYAPDSGDATISIYEMTGKLLTKAQGKLDKGLQEFRLSGLKSGSYLISVTGSTYQFSGKLLCNSKSAGTINIQKISNNQAVDEKKIKANSKGVQSTVDMAYTAGDRLKFTGISGIYSTTITDVLSADETITFNFITCTDGDNNNYPVVAIGTQLWMAKNLKTTKYNYGTEIPLVTDNVAWGSLSTPGYCWYNNEEGTYKATYGALYNWYAIDASNNVGKNICPTGWHVPTDAEWTTLKNYLTNIYLYLGKSLASATAWTPSTTVGAVGNTDYPAERNATGFSALPGGNRWEEGSFGLVGTYGLWWTFTGYSETNAMNISMYYKMSSFGWTGTPKRQGYSVRCLQGEVERFAILTTTAISSISSTSATCGGNITSDGGTTVTARGVCWSTQDVPTIIENKTSDGTGTGAFVSSITGLTPNTTYFVRAYATNSAGTVYGNMLILITNI